MAVLGIEGERRTAATKVAAAFRNAFNPTTLVALLLAAVLVFLVANPLFQLVKDSFTNARDHSFTFANYVTAFGRPRYLQALINSVELGAVAALFASIIAVPLAWGVSRTDMPGRGFVHVMVLASFLIPPFVGAIGWISSDGTPLTELMVSRAAWDTTALLRRVGGFADHDRLAYRSARVTSDGIAFARAALTGWPGHDRKATLR